MSTDGLDHRTTTNRQLSRRRDGMPGDNAALNATLAIAAGSAANVAALTFFTTFSVVTALAWAGLSAAGVCWPREFWTR